MTNGWPQTADIVSLEWYKSTMQHSAISQLEAYWQGLRNGRVVPSRSDIDPRGIEQALEFAFILERIAPGMARFRLAGMHLNDLMGMEVRGMPITTFFAPDTRQQINDALEHVFETPAIARFSLIAERGLGKPQSSAELIILPLRSDLGDISRALGCLVCHGEIGRTPRRFTVAELHLEPLEAGVVVGGPPSRAPRQRSSCDPWRCATAAARLCRGSHPDIPGAARRDAGAARKRCRQNATAATGSEGSRHRSRRRGGQ